jgi:hypothetical protein
MEPKLSVRSGRRLPAGVLLLTGALGVAAVAAPAPPPGHNVHLVQEASTGTFWRGGAPKRETIQALADAARSRGRAVTLVDLRKPATRDDLSGKGGRLSPAGEAAAARALGLRYLAVSALDRRLPERLQQALKAGDVYMHCMYGVNRTGYATARYSHATGAKVNTEKLGKRDWSQGIQYQKGLGRG